MSSIYQNYRPNNFSEILGQNHIKITLQNEIMTNNVSHAYLFCGPRAVGKTTTARILSKAVNCSNRKGGEFEPCDKCDNCVSIKKGNNFDVLEIDAASNTGVDNVRENIISFSRIAPSNGKYKVFIIDEVHMLSTQAFNALLKIMEEPPSYVIFILCTTEIQKIPGTIISRCERFDFRKISISEVVNKLSAIVSQEKVSVDKDVLESIAKNSGGYMRDAESLLGQVLAIGGKVIKREQAELILPASNDKEAILLISSLIKKDTVKAFSLINELADRGSNLKAFNNDLISVLRHLMIEKFSPGLGDQIGLDLGEDIEKELSKIISLISSDQVITYLKKFMETANLLSGQNIPQLPLEIAVAELCLGSATRTTEIKTTLSAKEAVSVKTSNYLEKNEVKSNTAGSIKAESLKSTSSSSSINKDINDKAIVNKPTVNLEPANTDTSANTLALKNMSPSEVYAKWPEFLVKIKNKNHSLSFVLQSCNPKEIKNNVLCLSFKYKFHQNRINESEISLMVKSVLQEVYGQGLDFSTVIDEDLKINEVVVEDVEESISFSEDNSVVAKESKNHDPSLGSVLNVFGGQIIN